MLNIVSFQFYIDVKKIKKKKKKKANEAGRVL
jgi:hypothetical protein